MFYAHNILAKQGPLAIIWLVAHWDKKITKEQVKQTEIENVVKTIREDYNGDNQDGIPIALRTSGHLLLGVSRIYSKKAQYLLVDVSDALGKIKQKPSKDKEMIDIPKGKDIASEETITQKRIEIDNAELELNLDLTLDEDYDESMLVDKDFSSFDMDSEEIVRRDDGTLDMSQMFNDDFLPNEEKQVDGEDEDILGNVEELREQNDSQLNPKEDVSELFNFDDEEENEEENKNTSSAGSKSPSPGPINDQTMEMEDMSISMDTNDLAAGKIDSDHSKEGEVEDEETDKKETDVVAQPEDAEVVEIDPELEPVVPVDEEHEITFSAVPSPKKLKIDEEDIEVPATANVVVVKKKKTTTNANRRKRNAKYFDKSIELDEDSNSQAVPEPKAESVKKMCLDINDVRDLFDTPSCAFFAYSFGDLFRENIVQTKTNKEKSMALVNPDLDVDEIVLDLGEEEEIPIEEEMPIAPEVNITLGNDDVSELNLTLANEEDEEEEPRFDDLIADDEEKIEDKESESQSESEDDSDNEDGDLEEIEKKKFEKRTELVKDTLQAAFKEQKEFTFESLVDTLKTSSKSKSGNPRRIVAAAFFEILTLKSEGKGRLDVRQEESYGDITIIDKCEDKCSGKCILSAPKTVAVE